MTPLAEIVSTLRSLIADEIGTTAGGRPAIGIEPSQRNPAVEGMTVLVCVAPKKGRASGKVTGGTFHEDMYEIKLINPIASDLDNSQALSNSKKMQKAREKISNAFNCRSDDYIAPESDRPEQCHIDVYMPRVVVR